MTQLVIFPWFGLPAHFVDALAIGAVFTRVSVLRSYALQRVFKTNPIRRSAYR